MAMGAPKKPLNIWLTHYTLMDHQAFTVKKNKLMGYTIVADTKL